MIQGVRFMMKGLAAFAANSSPLNQDYRETPLRQMWVEINGTQTLAFLG